MPTDTNSQPTPFAAASHDKNKEETSGLTLAQAVAAYLPEMLVAQLLQPISGRPDQTPPLVEPYYFEAVTMMVDVTGFTPLCEALARKGREGAEQVTALINGFFTPVLLQVQQQGGVIAKFGGDAFNAYFERQPHESWDSVVGRALHSAFTLQKLAHAYQELRLSDGDEPAPVFRLFAKVGLGAGSILVFGVGNPAIHCDFQVAGNPFNQAAEAEHAAGKGDIIAHDEFLARAQNLEPYLEQGERRGNCRVLLGFKAAATNKVTPLFDLASLAPDKRQQFLERAAAFVPKPIYERLKLGYAALPGEHRRVVSLFVNFRGFYWAEDAAAPAHFHAYYLAILEEVEHYRGQLNRISSGDKGDLLHIIFGAPLTYQDDEAQAVRCALSLQKIARRFNFIESQKIGLSSGFVFAGELGSPTRHEYTVMGDSVNLSARLMQAAADWSVLLDGETAQRLQGVFDFGPPRFLSLKGKSNLIEVCEVVQPREFALTSNETTSYAPAPLPSIYGRDPELEIAQANFELALQRQSRVLAVTGEPGIGKTLFLSHLALKWQKAGGQVCQVSLLNYERGAFNLWVKWLNRLLGLDTRATPEMRGTQLIQAISEIAPDLVEWAPLWGELLDLELPEPDWLRSLERQLRRQQLARLTPQLIAAIAKGQPLLLLADDFQWIDSASLELLDQVLPALKESALLVCLGYRPDQFPDLAVLGSNQSQLIALQSLAPEVSRQLVRTALSEKAADQPVSEHFVSLLGEMTGGNPFFIQELVAAVQANQAKAGPEAELAATPLSYNLQSLIMARLDGLSSGLREVVLAAAVVGGEFSAEMLKPLLPSTITRLLLQDASSDPLHQLYQLDLLHPTAPRSASYHFRQALLQQVAYDSLPFARRRILHEEVGDYFATQTGLEAAESQLERLTYHYERSANDAKAVLYLSRSAERSARLFANQESIRQYQAALQRAKRAKTSLQPGVTELLVGLGDVYSQTANFPAALENYGLALEQTPLTRALERSRLEQRRSEVLVRATRFSEALSAIEQAENELSQISRTSGQVKLIRAQLAELYSTILQRQAKFDAAIEWAERGLSLLQGSAARQPGAALAKVKLYQALAATAAMLKQMEQAQQALSRALRLSKSRQDPLTVSQLQLRLAILAGQREQVVKASVFFQAARPTLAKTGARDRLAHLLLPGGQNFLYRGEYTQAQEWLQEGLKLAEEINAPYLICSGYYLLARVDKETGAWQRALERYAQSIAIAAKYELWDRYAEFSSRQGELLAAQGRFAEAEALVRQAISCAEERKLPLTRKLCYRILAEIYYNQNLFEQAAECLRQGEVMAALEVANCTEAVVCLRLAEWQALSELNGTVEVLNLTTAQKTELCQKAKKALSLLQARGYGLFLPMAQRVNGLVMLAEQQPALALTHFNRGLALAKATANLPETAQLLTWRSHLKIKLNLAGSLRLSGKIWRTRRRCLLNWKRRRE